jgi:hypothetical protein
MKLTRGMPDECFSGLVPRLASPGFKFPSTGRGSGLWNIRLLLAIFALVTSAMAARSNDVVHGLPGAASEPLPDLEYVRTLPAPNQISVYGMFQSGTSRLTWSPDGERLAAYVNGGLGIITWSPDGKYQFVFPRHSSFGLDSYLLGFLSGHSQIITSPAAASKDLDEEKKVEEMAFSVMDATTGEVIRQIAGPNPGKTFRENIARHFSISPDQRLVAVIYHPYAAAASASIPPIAGSE